MTKKDTLIESHDFDVLYWNMLRTVTITIIMMKRVSELERTKRKKNETFNLDKVW